MYLGKPRCARRALLSLPTLLHRLASCAIAVSWQLLTRIRSTSWRAYTRGHAPAAGALDLHRSRHIGYDFSSHWETDRLDGPSTPAGGAASRSHPGATGARTSACITESWRHRAARSIASTPTLITPIDDGSNIHAVNCGPLRAGKDVAAGSSRSPQPISNWPRPITPWIRWCSARTRGAVLRRTAI